jgi:microcystin-dependent protein
MGLLEDLNSGKYNLVLFAIIFILFFHQYWGACSKTKEPMTNVSNDIKEAVKQVYLADVEAIRNLSEIATKINAGTFVFPGNLNVTGSFNYLPRGTIVAYNQTSAPAGWALCDGSQGTPDLRGRFIFGNGGSRGMNTTGGAESVTLGVHQMPQHNHTANVNDPGHQHHMIEGMGIVYAGSSWYARDGGLGGAHPRTNVAKTGINVDISYSGSNHPHENMPPFYVLTYIMKL